MKFKKSFTLIELIFVIVILGILSAVALPRFGNISDRAKKSKEKEDVASIRAGISSIRGIAILEGNTTDFGDSKYTGVYIDDVLIKVTKSKGFPLDLDNGDGTHNEVNTVATFNSVLDNGPTNWTINTKNNNKIVQYNTPSGKICTYTIENGKFECAW